MNTNDLSLLACWHLCVIREACRFKNLREFDTKGSHLTGPIPEWLGCFKDLQELDISSNRVRCSGMGVHNEPLLSRPHTRGSMTLS
jgi:hypothetical protein